MARREIVPEYVTREIMDVTREFVYLTEKIHDMTWDSVFREYLT